MPPGAAAALPKRLFSAGQAPGAAFSMAIRGWDKHVALWLASVALLSLAFPPLRWHWAAHLALVPMLISTARSLRKRVLLVAAAIAGAAFYAGEMYWLAMVGIPAYIGVILHCLIFWLAFAFLVRWTLRRTGLPLVLLAPVFWVVMELGRGWFLTGFPWLFLGHAQAANSYLRQLADLTGAYGLSALSAATSGLVADLVTRPVFLRYGQPPIPARRDRGGRVRLAKTLAAALAILAALWIFAVAYGWHRLRPVELTAGPLVVVVQPSVPQEVRALYPDSAPERDKEPPEYAQLRPLTDEALARWPEADLLVWPETMAPGYLNREFFEVELAGDGPKFQDEYRRRWREIHLWPRKSGAAMLVGAISCQFTAAGDKEHFNSALLFTAGDAEFVPAARYDKVHLVPFGEFVPFRESAPWLYRLLLAFTPYTQEYNLVAGREFTVLAAPVRAAAGTGGATQPARFCVPICFEDAFPGVCRQMAYRAGQKRADFLVNISNDGWFYGTVELEQHWDLSVLRAVENRTPVVRCVNTGVSGFIDSWGRTVGRVANAAGAVRSITGSAAWRLELDPRETFYGRWGDIFAGALCLMALSIIILAVFHAKPKENVA